jgi:hypothetical protein
MLKSLSTTLISRGIEVSRAGKALHSVASAPKAA